MQAQIIIPANGSAIETAPNKCLTILSATLPFLVSFGGAGNQVAQTGQVFDNRPRGFSFINFINPNASAITVIYDIGHQPATVQQSQKPSPTIAVGNPVNSLAQNATLVIPDGNNGRQRQQITISVQQATGSGYLAVLDANGNVYDTVSLNQTKTYVLNGTITLKALTQAVTQFTVGENYYMA